MPSLVLTSADVQRAGLVVLVALFGLAALLGGVLQWRGQPTRKSATYGSAVVAVGLFAYLVAAR